MLVLFITPSTFAANGNVYENQQYKFRMTFPDSWQISEPKGAIVGARSPERFPTLAIFGGTANSTKNTAGNMTQEIQEKMITRFVEKIQKTNPNMVLTDKCHVTISNHDAVRVTLKDEKTYSIIYFVFNDKFSFLIPIIGLESHLTTDQEKFNHMISTFKFLD